MKDGACSIWALCKRHQQAYYLPQKTSLAVSPPYKKLLNVKEIEFSPTICSLGVDIVEIQGMAVFMYAVLKALMIYMLDTVSWQE